MQPGQHALLGQLPLPDLQFRRAMGLGQWMREQHGLQQRFVRGFAIRAVQQHRLVPLLFKQLEHTPALRGKLPMGGLFVLPDGLFFGRVQGV